MGKFCAKCGNPLVNGQICACQQGAARQTQQTIGYPQRGGTQPGNARMQGAGGQPQPAQAGEMQGMGGQPQSAQAGRMQGMGGQPQSAQAGGMQGMGGQPQSAQAGRMQGMGGQPQSAQNGRMGVPGYPGSPQQNYAGQQQGIPYGNFAQAGQMQYRDQQYQQQFNQAKERSTNYLKALSYTFLDILKKPFAMGIQLVASQQISMIIGLFVFQGIMSALMGMMYAVKVSTLVSSASSAFSLFGGSGSSSDGLFLGMPYLRILLITVAGSVALSAILGLLLWGGGTLLKVNMNYKQALGVAALRSVILVPVTFAAILLGILSTWSGLALFMLSGIFGFCYMSGGFYYLVGDRRERAPVVLALVILLFLFISYIVISKLGMYYLPDTVRAAAGTAKGFLSDPSDLLDAIEDIF